VAKQFTLGKNERLKSRKSIEQLFNGGKKITASPYKVLYEFVPPTGAYSLLFSTGVSAKNFKKAVDRNRIKRLTREAWRLQKKELQDKLREYNRQLNVFFIYTGRELPEYEELKKKVASVIKKLDALTQA
jgi:ribonuclease P protein component